MELPELAERAVVALHMHFHAGMTRPGFEDCRKDLCGEWHAWVAEQAAIDEHIRTHCCGCDMPREDCVCNVT